MGSRFESRVIGAKRKPNVLAAGPAPGMVIDSGILSNCVKYECAFTVLYSYSCSQCSPPHLATLNKSLTKNQNTKTY